MDDQLYFHCEVLAATLTVAACARNRSVAQETASAQTQKQARCLDCEYHPYVQVGAVPLMTMSEAFPGLEEAI